MAVGGTKTTAEISKAKATVGKVGWENDSPRYPIRKPPGSRMAHAAHPITVMTQRSK